MACSRGNALQRSLTTEQRKSDERAAGNPGENKFSTLPAFCLGRRLARFPPRALCVHARVTPHDGCRVSPFGHPRIEARSAAPRGFSQPPTSFIGIRRQGIHRWLFIT